jgi:hypothetical protein
VSLLSDLSFTHELSREGTPANDAIYVVDPSHKGPTMAYLKKVTDAQTDVGYGSGWFKIQEAGLNVATQDWATTDLVLDLYTSIIET